MYNNIMHAEKISYICSKNSCMRNGLGIPISMEKPSWLEMTDSNNSDNDKHILVISVKQSGPSEPVAEIQMYQLLYVYVDQHI